MQVNRSSVRKGIGWGIFTVICIYYLVLKVFWLGFGMIILLCLYLCNNRFWRTIKRPILRHYFHLSLYLILPICLALLIRIFLIEVCVVPSSSMENTLYPGDRVVINKLAYGPRIPRSIVEVPWLHGLYLIFRGKEDYKNKLKASKKKAFKRWKGTSSIQHGDVVIFDSPVQKDLLLIKRFVGLPGDTILQKNGQVFINGAPQKVIPLSKMSYQIWPNNRVKTRKLLDSLNIPRFYHYSKSGSIPLWQCQINSAQLALLRKQSFIDSLKVLSFSKDSLTQKWHGQESWTINNFGPIIIPANGLTINLNKENRQIYQAIINKAKPDQIDHLKSFTFTQDYYFAMGDNKHASHDSRNWGFVPADHIVGKGSLILFSKNEDFSFFQRFLKVID